MEFYIEYNPYTLNTIYKKNGIEVLNSNIYDKRNARLQTLFNESENWEGLISEIVNECNSGVLNIKFKGRAIDFEDLEIAVEEHNEKEKTEITLDYIQSKSDEFIFSNIENLFKELKEEEAILSSDSEKNSKQQTIFEFYEKQKENIFDINVIATMSSGKSTLINALLGTELLPSKNEACTATVASILDNDNLENYEVEVINKYGEKIELEMVLEEVNTAEMINRFRKKATLSELERINENKNIHKIILEGNIPAVSSEKIKLKLNDTPGPNNSRDENHKIVTMNFIKNDNSVVLYILNAQQLEINDDKNLLEEISKEMKKAGKQSHDRFIFVINKADSLDDEKGELKNLKFKVNRYLDNFGIKNPILVPLSSRQSLLTRKNANGESLTKHEKKDLGGNLLFLDDKDEKGYHLEQYATLSPSIKEKLKIEYGEKVKENDEEGQILIQTGIRGLEELLKEYIDKYAYPIKVRELIDDVESTLKSVIEKEKFDEFIAKGEIEVKKIRDEIEKTEIDTTRREQIKKELNEEIQKIEENFKEKINIGERELLGKITNLKNKTYDSYKGKKLVIDSFKDEEEKLAKKIESEFASYSKSFTESLELELKKIDRRVTEQYIEKIKEISENIKIGKMELGNIKSISNFVNIDLISESNNSNELKKLIEKIPNPEKSGFLGKLKFWKSNEVEVVNFEEFAHKMFDNATNHFNNYIDNVKEYLENIMDEYRKWINSKVKDLENEIQNILIDIKRRLDKKTELEGNMENIKQRKEWFESKLKKIQTMLNF
ncbi:hypothetical protein HMPREF1983_00174 [Gemella bergeri ATCC 700627]|uniref:Dynamin N-terminal domain-containing protein n=1 Tax=Gemella bergeri ATCC 700627 TaxID=1321820 RepID=U2SCH4_9BACL|nr:dynamin family protein [Gemella bergeri]ERK60427.1 hypothetical protein HMPREF1983_00174 [Gemella bergeri ATCC 700627]